MCCEGKDEGGRRGLRMKREKRYRREVAERGTTADEGSGCLKDSWEKKKRN